MNLNYTEWGLFGGVRYGHMAIMGIVMGELAEGPRDALLLLHLNMFKLDIIWQ